LCRSTSAKRTQIYTTARQSVNNVCGCSPSAFNFQLDFSLACLPENISEGFETGISQSICSIDGGSTDSSVPDDKIPVIVDTVLVFELSLELTVINESPLSPRDGFVDGDSFSYTSVVASDLDQIPGGLQIRLNGRNTRDEVVTNDWLVVYSNNCDVTVFQTGDSIGWTVFTNVAPPRFELCPLLATNTPSLSPTQSLTQIPTRMPVTSTPTNTPVTLEPTDDPTMRPSIDRNPTKAPARVRQTDSPSIVPSNAPTKNPIASDAPTRSPLKTRRPTTQISTLLPIQTKRPTTQETTLSPTEEPTYMSMSYRYFDDDRDDQNMFFGHGFN